MFSLFFLSLEQSSLTKAKELVHALKCELEGLTLGTYDMLAWPSRLEMRDDKPWVYRIIE